VLLGLFLLIRRKIFVEGISDNILNMSLSENFVYGM